MARGIENYPNVTTPDSDYPNGRTKNNTGFNDGTPVKEFTLGDYQQWYAKLLREAEIIANGLPDNEYSGNQYYTATKKLFDKYGMTYIVTTSFTMLISAQRANMFNPILLIQPGAPSGIQIMLPAVWEPAELSTMTIVNDSSNSVDLASNLWNLNYVLPSPVATFAIPAGKTIEVTFITISGQFNWIISKKP